MLIGILSVTEQRPAPKEACLMTHSIWLKRV
jgi:hypothetical protein